MGSRAVAAVCLTLGLAAGVAGPRHAAAQTGVNVPIDNFRPAIDSRGYITVNASDVMSHLDISFGLVTDWSFRPLELVGPSWGRTPEYEADEATTYNVNHVISPALQAAFGILGIVEVAVTLPLHVVSGDVGPDFVGVDGDPRDDEKFNFSAQGLGDFGLHAKVRILDATRHPVGLGVLGSLYIPAGHDENEWLGESKLTPQVIGILDKDWRKFRHAANFGVRLRAE
jgi:hypothetical protein